MVDSITQPSSNTQTSSPTPTPGLRANVASFMPKNFAPTGAQTKTPCSYFLKGTCKRGVFCRYEHGVVPTTPEIRPPFAGRPDNRKKILCTFFKKGGCTKGDTCVFSHGLEDAKPSTSTYAKDNVSNFKADPILSGLGTSIQAIGANPNARLTNNTNTYSRALGGATVMFGEGAQVSSISLPCDFSAVSMSNLPEDVSVQDILDLLARHGFLNISPHSVVLTRIPQTSRQLAQVKVTDSDFAGHLLKRTGLSIDVKGSVVPITELKVGGESDTGTNRLQFASVACTWYNPSKVAYIKYATVSMSSEVLKTMNGSAQLLNGRKLNFAHQNLQRHTLQVGNLAVGTSRSALERLLPKQPAPQRISWGVLSHVMSPKEMEDHVKESLKKRGNLIDWVVSSQAGGSRTKAIAKFTDPEASRLAVKELNETSIDRTSNDKLRVAPIVSIKMSISHRMLEAVDGQLDALTERSWKSDYVSIKKYENPGKRYTQIRVFGESKDAVARVKSSVEKLLAGHIAMDQTTLISNNFFFQDSSTAFLESVMDANGVTIIRDLRKMVLRLYGDPASIMAVEDILVAKVSELATLSHTIVLDPTSLNAALVGGFRLLVASLGKDKVKLDVISIPKRIIINGSEQDLTHAHGILHTFATQSLEARTAALTTNEEDEGLCPVCWTPAEEPFKTNCGHVYCSSCFSSQCSSASEADFPIRCLGASATCNSPFLLSELKEVLATNDYETMLHTSFTGHIRSRPTEFQYCPTPDCDRFYRSSSTISPRIFDCDGCLSSICTGCHHITHDGLTCEAYKALAKAEHAGEKQFSEWKKRNDVRDCPECKTAIEKTYGCDHMECKGCSAHICWTCMKTFKNGDETYRHMTESHTDFLN
jgi:hypothetical protein